MAKSEDYFQGTREKPFEYEQGSWVLTETVRDPDGLTHFYYDSAVSYCTETAVARLHIQWRPGDDGWDEEYLPERPKTILEAFEDGIAWATMTAEAEGVGQAVLATMRERRPKRSGYGSTSTPSVVSASTIRARVAAFLGVSLEDVTVESHNGKPWARVVVPANQATIEVSTATVAVPKP